MKMNHFLALTCLVSLPAFAQLPDEINYIPYETRYQSVDREVKLQEERVLGSRSALRDVQKFIGEMGQHLAALQTQIRQNEEEIDFLRREIPELERRLAFLKNEDYRTDVQLRNRQQEEGRLSNRVQQEERELRRMEREISQRLQRLAQLESELNQLRLTERNIGKKLIDSQKDLGRINQYLSEARTQISKFQDDLRNAGSQLSALSLRISSLENSLSTFESSLNLEKSKASDLKNIIGEQERELIRLRSSNASPAELKSAMERLAGTKRDLTVTQKNIGTLESQISKSQSELRLAKTQFSRIQNEEREIPGRIRTLESKITQLEGERSRVTADVSRIESELQNIKRNADRQEQLVISAREELRPDQERIARQRQHVEVLARDLNLLRNEMTGLVQKSRGLKQEISTTQNTIVSHNSRIPVLLSANRNARTEIGKGEDELAKARSDEREFLAEISDLENELNDMKNRRDSAYSEVSRRKNLYFNYLTEAQKLGEDQAGIAKEKGRKEGERLAQFLGEINGTSSGKELGATEAKLWGNIRGETSGYSFGYEEGLRSVQDINNASQEASLKAAQDAEMFTQKNLRPVFFEEFVQEEFKKPSRLQAQLTKSLKSISYKSAMEARNEVVPTLTQEEIQDSLNLVTPLDEVITQFSAELAQAKKKSEKLADPETAYVAPVKIPVGTADCSRVYKGLEVFRAGCERSYKDFYQHHYLNAAKSTFVENYEAIYRYKLSEVNILQRDSSFKKEFNQAFEIGKAYGVTLGKKEIYASTFQKVYDTQYAVELEKAKLRARNAAEIDLRDFLKVKPLLTLSSKNVKAEFFRGGEEIDLSLKIRNVGNAPFEGAVLARITSLENAEALQGEGVLNNVPALGYSDLNTLKVKILPAARAGEKMVIKGIIHLPGDVYKASRQESFELVETLAANPSHEFKMDYNSTPSIKGPFKRYIHTVSVKVSPNVEDIRDGYEVLFNPLEESKELIELKETSSQTGPLKLGMAKEARFSYVLKNEAKGKEIKLLVKVNYLGKTIREEVIKLNPR